MIPTETPVAEITRPTLIKELPSKSLKMGIVVPVYREFKNGSIFRQIESLTKQTVSTTDWEALFLVNNTPEVMNQSAEAYNDNQRSLHVLRCISDGEPIPPEITGYRRTVIENAIKHKVKIHAIDMSTQGIENNMGLVRDIGAQEMIDRFRKTIMGGDGIIAQMDANTIVEPRYVEKILKYFQDSSLETLYLEMKSFNPEGSLDLHGTTFLHQYKLLTSQMRDMLYNQVEVRYSSQIVARADAYRKIGGIPHVEAGEDHALSKLLSATTKYTSAKDVNVYKSDRVKSDGYVSAMRGVYINEGVYRNPEEPEERWLAESLKTRLMRVTKKKGDMIPQRTEIEPLFTQHGIPYNEEAIQKVIFKNGVAMPASVAIRTYFEAYCKEVRFDNKTTPSKNIEEIVSFAEKNFGQEAEILKGDIRREELQQRIRHGFDRSIIDEAVDSMFSEGKYEPKGEKMKEFQDMNPDVMMYLNRLVSSHVSAEQVKADLKSTFPEWFEDYDKSRMRKITAKMQGIIAYFHDAKTHPNKFPNANEFINGVGQ